MKKSNNEKNTNPQVTRLNQLCDTLALCRYLGKKLNYGTEGCDNTFRYTLTFLSTYSPDVDAGEVLALLESLGAHCDCEIGLNVCAEMNA